MAVHIGARVGALAEADEILVSRTVADLVVGSGLRFTDRGEHELKGIAGRWRLFAVGDPADRPVQPPGSGSTEREMRLSDRIALQLARRTPRAMRAASERGRRAGRRRSAPTASDGSRRRGDQPSSTTATTTARRGAETGHPGRRA